MSDTIYALSSGSLPSGIAVVRVSGPRVRFVLETTLGRLPPPRKAGLSDIRSGGGDLIDRGLVLYFPAPASFTGEDVAEFHLHGGRAVVAAMLEALGRLPGLRLGEAGEFTRRAFEAGRLDLTEAEGLADLIAAETDSQRRQALRLSGGTFRARADGWRQVLIELRGRIEAGLDFSDEEDVPDDVEADVLDAIGRLGDDLRREIVDGRRGERLRDGFEVVVLGPPNAGKSSLVNAIAERDVAIVTDIPGTTRDLIEVRLDLGGYPVTLVDTAGLRDGGDVIEAEGMRRGRVRAEAADLIVWLDESGAPAPADVSALGVPVVDVASKADQAIKADQADAAREGRLSLSVRDRGSVDRLIAVLAAAAADALGGEPPLVNRARQRQCLEQAVAALDAAASEGQPPEIVADRLREAGDALGRLTGRIDVEDVLGSIFSTFCIGK